MIYRNFSAFITIQVLLILANCFVFTWSLGQYHLTIAPYTFGLILLIQVLYLISFIKRSNKKLIRFLEWIKNEGLSERFSRIESKGSHSELNQVFNEIIEIIADSRADKLNEEFYFQQVLKTMGTAIISFSNGNKVDIFNPSAKLILGIEQLKSISELKQKYPGFADCIANLKNNAQTTFNLKKENMHISVNIKCVDFKLRNNNIRLVSFQDISSELANKELDAWQKIIKVLRHEIMNSVTPIKSLTSTLIRLLTINGRAKTQNEVSNETISNTLIGLQAIEKRNLGMLSFIESYRNLTKIQTPSLSLFPIADLFGNITTLKGAELKANKVQLISLIEPNDLQVYADEKLIIQVLMNLLNNAIESVSTIENGQIKMEATVDEDSFIEIRIIDNGPGIKEDILDHVFIPFFSTKKEGSGIGLSLSRQIMSLHQGRIFVRSVPNKETAFILKF